MRLFLLLMVIALPALAAVESINFTWDTPTTNERGDPIGEQDIERYTIYFDDGTVLATIEGGGSTQYVHDLSLSAGETVCFQITATGVNGLESRKSDIGQEMLDQDDC